MEIKKGYFVRSLAGHDKDTIYVVVEKEKDFLYLADGKLRSMDHPKKKKVKHVQPIDQCLEESFNDVTIKRAIKMYKLSWASEREEA